MFEKINGFLKDAGNFINKALANPFVYSLWHAALGAGVAYGCSSFVTHETTFTLAGLKTAISGAIMGGAIGWARNSTNPTAQQIADAVQKAIDDKNQAAKDLTVDTTKTSSGTPS